MAVKTALVVDDSRSARLMLTKMLQKNGLEVDSVESGEAALDYLESKSPDVVFMDHMMPGIDGFETTRRICLNPRTSSIPVVMSTSKEGDEYIREAKALGACAILPKPATWPMIANILMDIETNMTSSSVTPAAVTTTPVIPAAVVDETHLQKLASQAATAALDQALAAALSAQLHDTILPQLEQWSEKLRTEFRQSLALQAENIQLPPAVDRDDITRQMQQSVSDAEQRMRQEWAKRMDTLEVDWQQLVENTTQRIEQGASSVTGVVSAVHHLEKEVARLVNTKDTKQPARQDDLKALESRLNQRLAELEQAPSPAKDLSMLASGVQKAQLYALAAGILGVATGLTAWFLG